MHRRMTRWLALLSLTAFAFSPAPQSEEQPVLQVTQIDRSQFPTLQVFVSVTGADGEPLPVAPEQLQLLEDGELVHLESVAGRGEIGPLTTLLVIDVSGSMAVEGKLKAAQAAAHAYIDQMRADDQAGVLAFNVESNLLQPITRNRQALHEAVDALETHNDTALYDALLEGVDLLESIQGRKAIIALTDGMDNSSQAPLDRVVTRTVRGRAIDLGDWPGGSLAARRLLRRTGRGGAQETRGKRRRLLRPGGGSGLADRHLPETRPRPAERIPPDLHHAVAIARWAQPSPDRALERKHCRRTSRLQPRRRPA